MADHVMTAKEKKRYERFQELEVIAQGAWANRVGSEGAYWMSLVEIDDDNLWDTSYDSKDEWLSSIAAETWGPSRSDYFRKRAAVDRLRAAGLSSQNVLLVIGSGKTAVIDDLAPMFEKSEGRTYLLTGEGQRHLGDDPAQAIMEIAGMPPSDARRHVKEMTGDREFWVAEASWRGEKTLLLRVVLSGGERRAQGFDVVVSIKAKGHTSALKEWLSRRFPVSRSNE